MKGVSIAINIPTVFPLNGNGKSLGQINDTEHVGNLAAYWTITIVRGKYYTAFDGFDLNI